MGKSVIKSLSSFVSGIGTVLFVMIFVQGSRVETARVASAADAESPSTTGASVKTAGNAPSNTLALQAELAEAGVTLGAPIYLRIFKSNGKDGALRTIGRVQGVMEERWFPNLKRAWVELWMQGKDGSYQLLKSYPVCTYTGNLGPKRGADDKQAPEGFYTIQRTGMNPNSTYFRSMDIGYPNAYDRLQRATGSQIKIHGMCISGGCFTMGEPQREDHQHMEELYTLVKAAHAEGQTQVPVHIFPFPMTDENMALHAHSSWIQFWTMLKPAYDLFERQHVPPQVLVFNGEYFIAPGSVQGLDHLWN